MNKRKYPAKYFWLNVIMNLIGLWYVLLIVIFLLVVRRFIPGGMSRMIPFSCFYSWLCYAFYRAYETRKTVLTSDHPSFDVFEDDDPHKAIIEMVDNAIKESQSEKSEDESEQ